MIWISIINLIIAFILIILIYKAENLNNKLSILGLFALNLILIILTIFIELKIL